MDRERIVGASPYWRQLRQLFHKMDIPISNKSEPIEHVSHGILVMNNNRGLFLQMRHTYEYKCILRGIYNGVKLYHYLSLITIDERRLLLEHPFIQWNTVYPDTKMPGDMYRKMVALQKHIEDILDYVSPVDNTNDEAYLLNIPKGRAEEGESSIEAAIRELREETGIDINPSDIKYTLKDRYIGTDGNIYTTYLYSVEMEELPIISLGREFKGYVWLSATDTLLMKRQMRILQTFISIRNDRYKQIFKCNNSGWLQ